MLTLFWVIFVMVMKPRISVRTATTKTKDTTIEKGAAIATTTDVTKKDAEINNATTMTSTPIAATSPSGSVSDHGSSKYVAENDLGQTSKGNKKVSIISAMILLPKWN